MDKRETSKRPTQEADGTRMFSSIVFRLRQSRPSDGGPASEEAAAPRSAGTTVDQLNGVWNSEWERRNPFGPAAPATAKAVFPKLYHACNDEEDSRAVLLTT